MANVPAVLLLAPAPTAPRGDGEEEDPRGQQRAYRWPGPGDAAPLVRGGRGGCEGNTQHMLTAFVLLS